MDLDYVVNRLKQKFSNYINEDNDVGDVITQLIRLNDKLLNVDEPNTIQQTYRTSFNDVPTSLQTSFSIVLPTTKFFLKRLRVFGRFPTDIYISDVIGTEKILYIGDVCNGVDISNVKFVKTKSVINLDFVRVPTLLGVSGMYIYIFVEWVQL